MSLIRSSASERTTTHLGQAHDRQRPLRAHDCAALRHRHKAARVEQEPRAARHRKIPPTAANRRSARARPCELIDLILVILPSPRTMNERVGSGMNHAALHLRGARGETIVGSRGVTRPGRALAGLCRGALIRGKRLPNGLNDSKQLTAEAPGGLCATGPRECRRREAA